MKIALECKDLILENSLKLFLKDYLVLKKDCDFLICDYRAKSAKPQFFIGEASFKPPFSKEKLLNELNLFNDALIANAAKQVSENQKILHKKLDDIIHHFRVSAYEKVDLLAANMKKDIAKLFEEK